MIADLFSIDRNTEIVATHYANLVNDYRGEFAASIYQKNPALVSVRQKFSAIAQKTSIKRLADYEVALQLATDAVKELALNASLGVDERLTFKKTHDKRLALYLKECNRLTMMSVSGSSMRDIKFGCDQLKTISFNVMTTMQNAGTSNAIKGAIVKSVVGGKNYTGVNGKEWRSITAVNAITRFHLLTVFNEVTLFVGSESGDSEFLIKTALSRNPLSNATITLQEYNEMRAKAFHPNANALIYRKISQQ